MSTTNKQKAIELRRAGKTYREIREEIPVAKSTLSNWFRSVELSVPQKQRITKLRRAAQRKGAQAKKDKRLGEVEEALEQGKKDIGSLSARELWLIGIALHWAEGSKQNVRSPSAGVVFGNMDYKMVLVFLRWLTILGVSYEDIIFTLYIHETRMSEASSFVLWWSKALGIKPAMITNVYSKPGKMNTNRKNVGDLYHGLIRIKVKMSTSLNRKIQGWFEAVYISARENT